MSLKNIKIILLLLFLTFPAFGQDENSLVGKWLNASGEGQIMIYRKGDKYEGRLYWMKQPLDQHGKPKRDSKNPNPAYQNRPLLGIGILSNFIYSGNNIWEQGSIYDPKTGKTYSCKITMVDNNKLNIRGFVGISILGRTEVWQRVQ
jgi:uncharacterized protein (DUF2147 family)